MEQITAFPDVRHTTYCACCGGVPESRDHVPSKVLLDEPYPDNLHAVPVCKPCNHGLSLDEEYMACVIECARLGARNPEQVERPKIRRILTDKPWLAAMIAASKIERSGGIMYAVDHARVARVVVKLARGHAFFDLSESHTEQPAHVAIMPICLLDREARERFESPSTPSVWPEVGSRKFLTILEGNMAEGWIHVQPGRYRYLVGVDAGMFVRMVLSDYLAGEVIWMRAG